MADIIHSIFQRKKADFSKLEAFGFVREGDVYAYRRTLPDSGFLLRVQIAADGTPSATILDPAFHEPYTLHLADHAAGGFVGSVRSRYEEVLGEIAAQCFEPDVFKSAQAKALIAYVKRAYGDEPEFLWNKFPDNAVWRRKDTKKWYGALLSVSKRKLGFESDEMAEIIDLRSEPDALADLIDGRTYLPGYHMNKKNWYTMLLDGSVGDEELCRRIDASYLLAVK